MNDVTPELLDEIEREREAAREEARAEAARQPAPDLAQVEDVDAGGVPARRYRPADPAGTMLYLHGGGFVMGDLVTHDGFARRLAAGTGWSVLMPDYRRAPEHPWPAAVQDASAAADWLADHEPGPGEPRRLAVVGDSAGSALAIGQVLRHPDRWLGQVQVYPFVDPSCASYDGSLADPFLPIERCRWYWDLYLRGGEGDDALHVLERGVLVGQPPALVQLAGLDVLTPTGHRYAERLAAAGVPVHVEVYPGVQHGFWRHTDNDQAGPAQVAVAEFLSGL